MPLDKSSLQKADLVLHILDVMDTKNMELSVQAYSNCREQGYAITMFGGDKRIKKVAFSQCRNSDSIVVYRGYNGDFLDGNIPIKEVYGERNFFQKGNGNECFQAAEFILDYFRN